MSSGKSIAVLGGGSWATAIVKMLLNNADKVHWWMRNQDAVNHIKEFHHNPNYLSSVAFEEGKIEVSTDLKAIIEAADTIVLVIPSAFIHTTFEPLDKNIFDNKTVFSAVKGIVPELHSIAARYLHKEYKVHYDRIGIICGPCHAEEVALEKLSYLTIACMDEDRANEMANQLACRYIKTSTTEDVFGTEISAVYKNVVAIACGIYHGLGYGDNFQAVLISNAIREIERFVDAVSPVHRDVKSSAYLGDLLVTGYSQFSRNRTFGNMLGKGYSVKFAQLEMSMIAEGYYAAKSILEMNKKVNVDIPIATAVFRVLYEKVSPSLEMKILADELT
jgi:glycerol-3-phosphate dehydrogenase (NAD(P)+)